MVEFEQKIYDPSYGGEPFDSLLEWQRHSLAAVVWTTRDGNDGYRLNSGPAWSQYVKFQ